MPDELVIGITFGLAGYLAAGPLAMPGEVLAWWPGLVQWLNRSRGKSSVNWNPAQHWSNKITWFCGKCIAGFWSLISAVFVYDVTMGQGFVCVTLAIFTAHFIDLWNQKN